MSYWFEERHTLVLARARIDLRNPRKRDWTTRKIGGRLRRARCC